VLTKIVWFASLCLMEVGEALRLGKTLSWVDELELDTTNFSLDPKFVVYTDNSNNSSSKLTMILEVLLVIVDS